MSLTRKVAVGVVILAAAIQLYRPDRTNPESDPALAFGAGGQVPADVNAIVTRACADCHSNQTRWPWYSHVAPASWMLASHVRDGRAHLNFSEWGAYDVKRQTHMLEEICEVVESGDMPLGGYVLLHGDARLSASDVRSLCDWAKREAEGLTSSGRALPSFAPAASHGDLVYVSGILPGPADGTTIESQTTHVIAELSKRLAQAGTDLERVVSTNVYLKRGSDFGGLNDVWSRTWPNRPPTRTTILTELPVASALVQVSAVAVKPGVAIDTVLPKGWQAPAHPYSYAIRAGDALFLSGLVPRDPGTGQPIAGNIETQTKAVLDAAGAILEAGGLSFANVVSSRVFISNVSDFQAMNATYRPYFGDAPPARATVRATLTNPAFLVEVTLTAAAGGTRIVYTTPGEDGAPGQINPNLSSAIGLGPRLFLSGMLGVTPGTTRDAVAQTNETLARLERTMALAGVGWPQVVDTVVYVTDVSKAGPILEAVQARSGGRLPSGALVGAGLVSTEGLVEIMLTAGR